MKKLLYLLLTITFLLPTYVNADEIYLNSSYNQRPSVGGELEIVTPIPERVTKVKYSYDSTMLKPYSDMALINTHELNANGEITKKYVKNVILEDGSITIELDPTIYDSIFDDYSSGENLHVVFIPLKEGESNISVDYMVDTIHHLAINFEAKKVSTTNSEEEKKDEVKEDKKDYTNIFLYISLGANALLLIVLLIVGLKKKKNIIVNE